jgi:hypothetical protein
MPNITMNVDENVIKKVRKLAIDRNTTMTALIRDYLENLAEQEAMERRLSLDELEAGFSRYSRAHGSKTWTRQDLHER